MRINAKKLVHTKELTREDWLRWRQKGIGGSDVAGILNMNPKYTSPLKVYLSKVEEVEAGETSEAAEWGTIMEPVIRDQFKKRHRELRVRQSHFMWQHPDYPFMLANVDGFLYDPDKGWGVLEIKTASEYLLGKWSEEDGQVPEEYLLQAQHYLATLGLDYGYFAVLIGGNKYREFYFERDQDLIDSLIVLESDFWNNHVIPQIPPELDGSEASKELVSNMFPAESARDQEEILALPKEVGSLLEVLDETKEAIKGLKERQTEIENKLKRSLGEYQKASFLDREIKWTVVNGTNFDKKSLKEDHPEIYSKYVKPNPYRKLTV
ncbi:MAG: YqaJ viral recombinase family protein [Bacillus sp. (in: firmicutes)]